MIKVTYIGHSSVLVEWPIIITKGDPNLSFKSRFPSFYFLTFSKYRWLETICNNPQYQYRS